jgi:hypothetical protein
LKIARQMNFIYPRGPRPLGATGAFLDLVLRATGKIAHAQDSMPITSGYDI